METNNNLSSQSPFPENPQENAVYFEKKTWFSEYKQIIVVAIFFLVVAILVIPKVFHKDARNISLSDNRLSMILGKSKISAELSQESTTSFLINSGKTSSLNTGNFAVIPMEKVEYLERKYTDFIHCGSPGEAEGKSSLSDIGLIAATPGAEIGLRRVEELVKKGNLVVIEINGSELKNITGLKSEVSNYGIIMVEKMRPNNYYLVNDIKIIKEKYQ